MDYLDAAKPDLLAKYAGLWVCVSEYGVIVSTAVSKQELERKNNFPHEGCGLQLCRVPATLPA